MLTVGEKFPVGNFEETKKKKQKKIIGGSGKMQHRDLHKNTLFELFLFSSNTHTHQKGCTFIISSSVRPGLCRFKCHWTLHCIKRERFKNWHLKWDANNRRPLPPLLPLNSKLILCSILVRFKPLLPSGPHRSY